jgi:hypothetical protein
LAAERAKAKALAYLDAMAEDLACQTTRAKAWVWLDVSECLKIAGVAAATFLVF